MGVHTTRTDLRNRGVYTITRDGNDIGVVSFLIPPPTIATVLRKLCQALDAAALEEVPT